MTKLTNYIHLNIYDFARAADINWNSYKEEKVDKNGFVEIVFTDTKSFNTTGI